MGKSTKSTKSTLINAENAGIVENIWKKIKIKFFQQEKQQEKKHQNNFQQNFEVLNVSKINPMKQSTQELWGNQQNQPNPL